MLHCPNKHVNQSEPYFVYSTSGGGGTFVDCKDCNMLLYYVDSGKWHMSKAYRSYLRLNKDGRRNDTRHVGRAIGQSNL